MAEAKKPKQRNAAQKPQPREKPYGSECCPPRAMLWIDAQSSQIFIENRIDQQTRLDVRAAIAQSTTPPPVQGMVQNAASDSELDTSTLKPQGKVYRTDRYTVHWRAEGQCRPLDLSLRVDGEVRYRADCLPEEGEVTLSRAYLLEPPAYNPPGPGTVSADLNVVDCAGLSSSCRNEVPRP